MAYSTLDDLLKQIDERKVIQLTDDEGLGLINVERVEEAIAGADAVIDGYVGTRHPVPLNPVQPMIRSVSVTIAIYKLYSRSDLVPETRSKDLANAIRFLELVAKGELSLGANDPGGNPPSGAASWTGRDQVMTPAKLERF